MVLVVKGGHTPHCTPEGIRSQLHESLARLRIDQASIYMPHRDNLEVPVDEFVDVLNELRDQGLIRVFGVSNWTTDRIRAANEYAHAHRMRGIVAVSNNFSLAKMIEPLFPGCVSLVGKESREWFITNSMPLMPWSSQGRRFFTTPLSGLAQDDQVARCWLSPANLERRRRAGILARDRGVDTVEVALAYVLGQPFPTFPMIGPQTVAELQGSMRGLTVRLSSREVRWLEHSEPALAAEHGHLTPVLQAPSVLRQRSRT
jgi:aryl-alcohol dehydrogenase-like predicted oxidoreductase